MTPAAGDGSDRSARSPLSLTTLVLPGSVIALAAIVLGGSMLYPAWHEPLHGGFKALWLDRTFFTVRAFAYVAAWLLSLLPATSSPVVAECRILRGHPRLCSSWSSFGSASLAFFRFTKGSAGAAAALLTSVAFWIAAPLTAVMLRLRRTDF